MSSNEPGGLETDAPRPKKQKTGGGFKWKAKSSSTTDERKDTEDQGLQRGYRDRSPRKHSYTDRDRSPRRDHHDNRDLSPRRDDQYRSHDRTRRRDDDYRSRDSYRSRDDHYDRDRDRYRYRNEMREERNRDIEGTTRHDRKSLGTDDQQIDENAITQPDSKAMNTELSQSAADKFGLSTDKSAQKDKTKKKTPRIQAPSEPMIVVNINDRLGTKAAIPCLASDSVKAFKAIVAAHIGRQPHEIMLKRQGERPFKDQLTLEDYGVSSGVQLDLEIDTGD